MLNQAMDQEPPGPDGPAPDPHRPRYHFLPPANWMNDPNGLIHWQGTYHLFYQYNPAGAFHHAIHWGHAVSTDLVVWEHLPIALAPTPGGADADGCFSGCAVDHDGVPTFIYTGVHGARQRACLATSADNLRTWQKYPGNPVIAEPPPGVDLVAYRDHSVWREGDTWYQVMGAGIRSQGGTALLYRSPDLIHWEYLHPLTVGDGQAITPVWTGSMWECPDFFALGAGHVLVVSVWDDDRLFYPVAFTGTYAEHRLIPDQVQQLDFGVSFYAPQTLRDAAGRRIMCGWLREERDDAAQRAAGWSGVLSLPRVLTLRADGRVDMRPAPELARLRGAHVHLEASDLASGVGERLSAVQGDTLEIRAEFGVGDEGVVGLVVCASPDGAEQTRITYDCAAQRLSVDTTQASQSAAAPGSVQSGPLALAPGETLRLHIFLDRSVVEVFANEHVCLTSRIYPTRPDSRGLAVVADAARARLLSLDVWSLTAIWPASA